MVSPMLSCGETLKIVDRVVIPVVVLVVDVIATGNRSMYRLPDVSMQRVVNVLLSDLVPLVAIEIPRSRFADVTPTLEENLCKLVVSGSRHAASSDR